jgi:hypothetical protein
MKKLITFDHYFLLSMLHVGIRPQLEGLALQTKHIQVLSLRGFLSHTF